jgi:predicted membrane protein
MKNSSSSYVAGIILILFGGVWLTSNTGIFDFDIWEYFWPSFFIAIGVVLAVKRKALFIATLFIFFGALNLASSILYISFDELFQNFWPVILITLGILLLFRKQENGSRRHRHHRKDDRAFGNPFYYNGTEKNSGTEKEPGSESNSDSKTVENDENKEKASDANTGFQFHSDSNSTHYSDNKGSFYSDKNHFYYDANAGSSMPLDVDKIDEVAILTSCRKYITSQNFKGGKMTAILGGGIIDLSGAKLAEGENILELTSIMGGVSFRVPQDWKVTVNVHSIFGGFEDKRHYFNKVEVKTDSALIITGNVIMGGGTLTY